MTLPSYAVSQLRAAAKIRWLLATYGDAAVAQVASDAGTPLPPIGAWYVGSDAGALPQTLDVLPAVVCVPVAASVTDTSTGEVPYSSADSVTTWAIRCIADADAYGPDTAAQQALGISLAVAGLLVRRMPEPRALTTATTWVWGAAMVQDAPLPTYVGDSQHRIMHEAQIEIMLRSADPVANTAWPPGIGVAPALPSAQASVPSLVVTGDATATVAPGASAPIAASAYVAGLTLSTGTGATLVAQSQDGPAYPSHPVPDGATITPADLSASPGTVWTVAGVHPVTGAVLAYRLAFT